MTTIAFPWHAQDQATRLGALSKLLRTRSAWPEDFHWDYSRMHTCAIALVDEVWLQGRTRPPVTVAAWEQQVEFLSRLFVTDPMFIRHIFSGVLAKGWLRRSARWLTLGFVSFVTPEEVADMVDDVIKSCREAEKLVLDFSGYVAPPHVEPLQGETLTASVPIFDGTVWAEEPEPEPEPEQADNVVPFHKAGNVVPFPTERRERVEARLRVG